MASLFNLEEFKNGPRNILQPSLIAGNCFGFIGQEGEVTVKLNDWVRYSEICLQTDKRIK